MSARSATTAYLWTAPCVDPGFVAAQRAATLAFVDNSSTCAVLCGSVTDACLALHVECSWLVQGSSISGCHGCMLERAIGLRSCCKAFVCLWCEWLFQAVTQSWNLCPEAEVRHVFP